MSENKMTAPPLTAVATSLIKDEISQSVIPAGLSGAAEGEEGSEAESRDPVKKNGFPRIKSGAGLSSPE